MRDYLMVTIPDGKSKRVHIIKPTTGLPCCGAQHMTVRTEIIGFDYLMEMDMRDMVCKTCLSAELLGDF